MRRRTGAAEAFEGLDVAKRADHTSGARSSPRGLRVIMRAGVAGLTVREVAKEPGSPPAR